MLNILRHIKLTCLFILRAKTSSSLYCDLGGSPLEVTAHNNNNDLFVKQSKNKDVYRF